MTQNARVERAAGGLVLRNGPGGLEVLMIDDAYGHLSFPKGHLEAGETWEDAAIREVFEETGIEARILTPLGRVGYPISRDGTPIRKQVRLFLLEAIDEQDEPHHQAEEVEGARFINWQEAVSLHQDKGYANWNWVLDKAQALWTWHQRKLDQRWRAVPASSGTKELVGIWNEVEPVMESMREAIVQELKSVAPEISANLPAHSEVSFPLAIDDEDSAIRGAIEHTLLKPEASAVDIENLCVEARTHRFRAVCVNPIHVELIHSVLDGSEVIPCTVVGFPLGATDVEALATETARVVASGARDVDMVIPIGAMREDDIWTVYQHVQTVCDVAHRTPDVKVKVILEAHFLTVGQLMKACLVSLAAGVDFLKTSTGFAPSGAKISDVAAMAWIAGTSAGVKAAGGIRTRNDALNYLRFGANRIGTSSGLHMIR